MIVFYFIESHHSVTACEQYVLIVVINTESLHKRLRLKPCDTRNFESSLIDERDGFLDLVDVFLVDELDVFFGEQVLARGRVVFLRVLLRQHLEELLQLRLLWDALLLQHHDQLVRVADQQVVDVLLVDQVVQ